jgi:hypothetical protein
MAPRTEFNQGVKDILARLELAFEARSEFLEICLRSQRVPRTGRGETNASSTSQEQPEVRKVLQGEDWEQVLLDAINAYAAAYKPERGEQPVPEPRRRSSGIEPVEETHNTPLPRGQVDAFLTQHLLHFFSSDDSPTVNPEFERVKVEHLLALWEPWLLRTITIFFDATMLEIISWRPLAGRIAVDSYNRTIRVVRRYYSEKQQQLSLNDDAADSLAGKIEAWDATRSALAAGLPAQSMIERRLLRAATGEGCSSI